ncbi:hypothetical protein GHT06_008642 [Daphnia sinensis]|uniref:RING-type E3 ubiquitin transferase n=1 Tax=Daphnia sinensis TaxID=1820382 RepID=A0AAD5PYN3_9CRUS|nr:hypothetical protein GHT06_008642 [Daphnia sinensis]
MASQKAALLTCDICREEYDTLKKRPIFLRCFHTFCLLCLQKETTNNTTIRCRTCKQESSIDIKKDNMGLEENDKVMAQLEYSTSPSANLSDTEVKNERYLWCLTCKLTVTEETDCVKTHTAMDLESAKEKINDHFQELLIKYRSQLYGHLNKHRETESALEAVQSALRVISMQASCYRKENQFQIRKLQKQLKAVNKLLDNPPEEQQKDEDVHKSIQMYNKLVEQTSNIKTTDFDRIRNTVVSLNVQTPGGQQLPTSLFNSALINFPSEGANEQESNLLTTLSFLIYMSIQKGPQMTTKPPRKMSETSEKPPQTVNFKMDKADEKEEAVRNKVEPTEQSQPIARSPFGLLRRSTSFNSNKPDSSGPRPYRDYPKDQQTCVRNQRQDRFPSNDQVAATRKTSDHLQVTFQVPSPAPVTIPPLMSLQTKKAFLALAVNGKPYGNIVIELQPNMAPIMCDKFVKCCITNEGPSYQGTLIYQAKNTYIMGGKLPGQEVLYMADESPLKKNRGAIFFRLKRDYVKTQCSIVSTDFCIHLGERSPDNHRTSTVFGYVCDGLAVCDAISHMDCNRNHVAISAAGLIG